MARGRKTGGRIKGTPNKPKPQKQILQALSAEYWDSQRMRDDLESLEPRDRLLVELKIMEFHTPKMQATAIDVSSSGTKTREDRLAALCGEE